MRTRTDGLKEMAELKKKLKKRTGHRAFITKTLKVKKEYVDPEKFKENIDLPFLSIAVKID